MIQSRKPRWSSPVEPCHSFLCWPAFLHNVLNGNRSTLPRPQDSNFMQVFKRLHCLRHPFTSSQQVLPFQGRNIAMSASQKFPQRRITSNILSMRWQLHTPCTNSKPNQLDIKMRKLGFKILLFRLLARLSHHAHLQRRRPDAQRPFVDVQ